MVQSEVENDGFEAGEVFTGPEDCQMTLNLGRTRFVLVMIRPECRKEGDVVAGMFQKIDEAEEDPDELVEFRCLDDIRESAISACKHTMYKLSATVQKPNDLAQSLEDFFHPPTFYLQLCSKEGHLHALTMDDTSEYSSTYEPVLFPMDLVPQSAQISVPASTLEFVEDLYMGKVLKVLKNGNVCVFKSANSRHDTQLKREIDALRQINETWKSDHSNRPFVPRLLHLVTSENQIAGILEEIINGEKLSEFEMKEISVVRRQKWRSGIEQSITQLHRNDIVWGDVKPENILIDKEERPWLIDFGGSTTDGWVDRDLAETVQGDLQGLRRIVEYLGFKK